MGAKKVNIPESWEADMNELASQKQQVWQQIRKLDPVLAGQYQVPPLNIKEMQGLIDNPTTAILSFYTTNKGTYIFILRHVETFHETSLHICKGQGIQTLHGEFIWTDWLTPYREDINKWINNIPTFLQELSKRLQLDDLIETHLTDIEELIIVPHLLLHIIPFSALPIYQKSEIVGARHAVPVQLTETTKGSNTKWGMPETDNTSVTEQTTPPPQQQKQQYLGDRFRIRLIPSCQILKYCHDRPTIDTKKIGIVEDATEDLAFTSYYCEHLAQSYNIDRRLRGKDATVSEYKKLAQTVQILHSSHHASADLNNPLESQLYLADGTLTLGELMTPGWRMPNLGDVELICCETNFTVTQLTDDILTLATGFLCAGARSVVSTQWSVSDFSSALLLIFYYEYRTSGSSRSLALQQAQFKLRTLTGEKLRAKYSMQLHQHLQEKLEEAEGASQKEIAETIKKQQRILEQRCNKLHPFAEPFHWAGFVSQGLS